MSEQNNTTPIYPKRTHNIKWDLKQGLQLEPLKNDICFEYSENKKHLKALLAEIGVSVQRVGYEAHFTDENTKRTKLEVTITRGSLKVSFVYGMSTIDSDYLEFNKTGRSLYPSYSDLRKHGLKIRAQLLYDILACCRSDSYVQDTFMEFCAEFGYNEDSKTDTELYLRCLTQRAKIRAIFQSSADLDSLPS